MPRAVGFCGLLPEDFKFVAFTLVQSGTVNWYNNDAILYHIQDILLITLINRTIYSGLSSGEAKCYWTILKAINEALNLLLKLIVTGCK